MNAPVAYPPITLMPGLSAWEQTLQEIATEPLEFCQDFPAIAPRFEAWWAHDALDRPVFMAAAEADPSRSITRRLELLKQPDAWFEAKLADMHQFHRVGDALPWIRVDFGPVLLGGLLGGEIEFGADTTESLFLPDIARQAATVGRAVFHLDGPDAARHTDALLSVPEIQAVQFTPGAGTPSALAWTDMLRKIQAHGRSVLIICPPEEVLALSEALSPQGLAILVSDPLPPDGLDDLFAQLCRHYSCSSPPHAI